MEIEVQSKQENKLLNRLEVRFAITHLEGATPRRETVRQELGKLLKVKDQPLVIDHIHTQFGKRQARGYAKVYNSLEDATRVERKHVLRRNQLLGEERVEEPPAEEAAAEEPPPEEAPSEEAPTEEAPAEPAEESSEAQGEE